MLWSQVELDARVAQSQQHLRERDDEISRLRRELTVGTKSELVLSIDSYGAFSCTGSNCIPGCESSSIAVPTSTTTCEFTIHRFN